MGDIADWILEGGMCQVCGVELDDGEEAGYPRSCSGCSQSNASSQPIKTISCRHPGCRKKFQTDPAADQHYRDKHAKKAKETYGRDKKTVDSCQRSR